MYLNHFFPPLMYMHCRILVCKFPSAKYRTIMDGDDNCVSVFISSLLIIMLTHFLVLNALYERVRFSQSKPGGITIKGSSFVQSHFLLFDKTSYSSSNILQICAKLLSEVNITCLAVDYCSLSVINRAVHLEMFK